MSHFIALDIMTRCNTNKVLTGGLKGPYPRGFWMDLVRRFPTCSRFPRWQENPIEALSRFLQQARWDTPTTMVFGGRERKGSMDHDHHVGASIQDAGLAPWTTPSFAAGRLHVHMHGRKDGRRGVWVSHPTRPKMLGITDAGSRKKCWKSTSGKSATGLQMHRKR